jgi:hypothetical protein
LRFGGKYDVKSYVIKLEVSILLLRFGGKYDVKSYVIKLEVSILLLRFRRYTWIG